MSVALPVATRAVALAMLLVRGDPAVRRGMLPALGQATGALGVGARSLSGIAGVAARLGRRQPVRPEEWEREVVGLRYAAWDAAPGPARERALAAYRDRVGAARLAIGARASRDCRERVGAVLRVERRMLAGRRLRPAERSAAEHAVACGLADVEGRGLP